MSTARPKQSRTPLGLPLAVLALFGFACGSPPAPQEFWRPWYARTESDSPSEIVDAASMPPAMVDGGGGADLAPPASACSLRVAVTTLAAGGKYAPRNIGAIWISDGGDRFVKTLAVWAEKRAKYLQAWNASTAAAMLPGNRTDAISSATQSAHGPRSATWNCKDSSGQLRSPGAYKICFELTDRDGAGPSHCVPFTTGAMPWNVSPPDAPSFSAQRLEFQP